MLVHLVSCKTNLMIPTLILGTIAVDLKRKKKEKNNWTGPLLFHSFTLNRHPDIWFSSQIFSFILKITMGYFCATFQNQSVCVYFVAGPVSSTEHVWISPEEQSCWFGTMTPTLRSLASHCSASLKTKTVSEHYSPFFLTLLLLFYLFVSDTVVHHQRVYKVSVIFQLFGFVCWCKLYIEYMLQLMNIP